MPPCLAGIVTRLWFLEMPRPRPLEKVLPLPATHLIANLSTPYATLGPDGTRTPVPDVFVAGIRADFIVNELPETVRHIGAELTPAGLSALSPRASVAWQRSA